MIAVISRSEIRTACTKALSLSGSLIPVRDSTPEATSTPQGPT